MTDEEAFNKFLDQAGFMIMRSDDIEHSEEINIRDKNHMFVMMEKDSADTSDYTFGCGEYGYSGFFASFMFDKNGKLKARCVGE